MFKFDFMGDEDVCQPDFDMPIETSPIIPCEEYDAHTLIGQIVEVEKVSILGRNGEHISYKRPLSDIQLQLAREDSMDGNNNEDINDWINGKDVVKYVYEGGFKTWESAIDLARYLVGLDPLLFQNKNIIELGCGSALPSLSVLPFNPNKLHFSDYNNQVLKLITIPNVLATNQLQFINEDDIEVELNPFDSQKFKFFSGDWDTLPKVANNNKYDVILSTETIYIMELIPKLIKVIEELLVYPNGIAFVAAKTMYFGCGGGTLPFKQALSNLTCETVYQHDDGVAREILKLQWKQDQNI